jgi:hypothetical protein
VLESLGVVRDMLLRFRQANGTMLPRRWLYLQPKFPLPIRFCCSVTFRRPMKLTVESAYSEQTSLGNGN